MAEEFNFEQSPEELEAEIAKIADETAIKYLVTDGSFVSKFPDGRIIKVPIKLSVNQADSLDAEGASSIDQAKQLIRLFGSEEEQEYLADADMMVVIDFVNKYMTVLQRIQGLTLGESSPSSAS